MNLIDSSYFIDEIALPGFKSESKYQTFDDITVNGMNLTRFISVHQKHFLHLLLGEKLANAFLREISAESPSEIWTDIKNHLVDSELKISPIANYVYFFVMRYGVTYTSPSGEKKGKSDYAYNASPRDKCIFAWNAMVDMNICFAEWLLLNFDRYREFTDSYSIACMINPELLEFINPCI
ncbi:MAG: hypothetical protein LBG15_03215 [Dysgonamonadaceae bacterium]|jgi:hypothetical protein|nr:hypothetical protein [Dysgonamonadaceae bacterium]